MVRVRPFSFGIELNGYPFFGLVACTSKLGKKFLVSFVVAFSNLFSRILHQLTQLLITRLVTSIKTIRLKLCVCHRQCLFNYST